MAMNMSNLLKLSLIVRKLTVSSNNTIRPIRLFRTSYYAKRELENDEVVQTQVSEQQQRAKRSTQSYRLSMKTKLRPTNNDDFHIIDADTTTRSGCQAVKALQKLYSLDKNKRCKSASTSKEFARICDILNDRTEELDSNQLIESFKILTYYHVPSSSKTVEKLLRTICNSIHRLSVTQILILENSLSRSIQTPLVEGITIALPVIMQCLVQSQLHTQDVHVLVDLQRYFMKSPRKEDMMPAIIDALAKVDESSMTPPLAHSVLRNLDEYNLDDTAIELLKKCQKILSNATNDMSPGHLISIANTIQRILLAGGEVAYNESLLDACATTVISKNMGFDTAIKLLLVFNKVSHAHNSMLDYIAALCFENKDIGKKMAVGSATTLIRGLSIADYKPVFWETLQDILVNHGQYEFPKSEMPRMGIYMASVDIYCPKFLAKTFTADENNPTFTYHSHLSMLHNAVKLYYPEYNGPWPSDELLLKCKQYPIELKTHNRLKSALECVLGGSQYILTNVPLMPCHTIDHVVVMRKGGFPIALNSPNDPVPLTFDDLKPPPDSQVIVVMYVPKSGYARNTRGLNGMFSLKMRMLKSLKDSTVISIHEGVWIKLSESEQVRYVSQAIRLKCDELSAVIN